MPFPGKVSGCSRVPRVFLVGLLALFQFFFGLKAFVRLKGQFHKGSMAKISDSKITDMFKLETSNYGPTGIIS